MIITCYMCEQVKTSREHAPPKCIFPEIKDIEDGENYRKDLIRVPSCDEHNSNKSKDDEFLLFILLHGYFNNKVGENQFHSKALRAFERRPRFLEKLYEGKVPVVVDGVEATAVDIDIKRFNNEISNICRALYYDEYQEKWLHNIDVYSPMFLAIYQEHENEINERVINIYSCVEKGLRYEKEKGENPEVFLYKIKRNREKTKLLCYFVFYGGFKVSAHSIIET